MGILIQKSQKKLKQEELKTLLPRIYTICQKKIQKKQLYELFCKSGNVSKVVMPIDRTTGLPRGFAFVSMSTLLELERIIALSNKIEASGHKILVKIAKARRKFFKFARPILDFFIRISFILYHLNH